MPHGFMRIIGGVLLALALVVAGLTMYRPPRASYIDVTPEPISRPAVVAQATSGVAAGVVPTVATNRTLTFSEHALIVAAGMFPAQQQIAPAAPIIISFAAQSAAMQGLCAETAGVLDSGLCAVRSLTVATVDDAGVHIPLTAQQARSLGRVRDADVALTVARDNALLMATPEAQVPAAAVVASAPAATVGSTAATAVVAASSAQPRQNLTAETVVDGLPLVPILLGVLLIALCIGVTTFLLRRRNVGRVGGQPRAAALRTPRARNGAAPPSPARSAGLSLNLGDTAMSPLLDDDDPMAQSAPRAIGSSFERASALPEDDRFALAPASDARLFASDAAHPALPDPFEDPGVDASKRGRLASAGLDALGVTDDDVWSTQAAVEPWAGLAERDVFGIPASPAGLGGLLDDRVAEPIATPSESIIVQLGEKLPPAREKGALPPTAALDRQAALRWVLRRS